MTIHSKAGQGAKQEDLYNIPALVANYFLLKPDLNNPEHMVQFGTSGHRGSADKYTFNENHILGIVQAIVELRDEKNITGPLFIGKDTHALSEPAFATAIEVLIANNIKVIVQENNGYTPTPAISHAILSFNSVHKDKADGLVITPSHNPPQDGGIKYNYVHGGPAGSELTQLIEERANLFISKKLKDVKRISLSKAKLSSLFIEKDLAKSYINDLVNVINIQAIQNANLKLGVDPLGGSGINYWKKIGEVYNLDLTLIREDIDPSFRFMSLDKDGVIRMDCSSPYAISSLIDSRGSYDLSFGNDPDHDRHCIVTPQGLVESNHFLAVCIDYLYRYRKNWNQNIAVGKTLVSSYLIDCVVENLGRKLYEVPVGFKWFVDDLYKCQLGFAAEESGGASFLRKDGTPWSTDKDGIILCLLAAEITAVTGKNPQKYYEDLVGKHGKFWYDRAQVFANRFQRDILAKLSPEMIPIKTLAGSDIVSRLTHASGNNVNIGGLKITTKDGWFVIRPSGTEDMYKIYFESFKSEEHLRLIKVEVEEIVNQIFSDTKLGKNFNE
ncbi:phosphoglucomutase (alpha-D-glucose-1,6-bisphosphate-dependent) [Candidatus Photodesmus anomalopis]|uniref:Phosphoglucomutase n=1 Tax=Candidatus Photodesmus katoptron Akat1 TaxID=1236703 RepID=S3DIY3_9GAMM|nr:phosphoglucomutase (alpha-D-glucose-1,6-bisphosphate-dependent) [Candidatus Photodesmus katoptron]EPE37670.1 phosphoglucomutase, alpha-D-glucose phosphate-specific [Candidatus Photodesmus katoptron Akat1]